MSGPTLMPPFTLPAPSQAVCSLLGGFVTPMVTLTLGVNLFRGYLREVENTPNGPASQAVPDVAVFVHTVSGEAPQAVNDGTARLVSTVAVYVRGARNAFGPSEDMARSIWRQVNFNVPPGFIDCRCSESEPSFLDLDDTQHPRWVIPLRLIREE